MMHRHGWNSTPQYEPNDRLGGNRQSELLGMAPDCGTVLHGSHDDGRPQKLLWRGGSHAAALGRSRGSAE